MVWKKNQRTNSLPGKHDGVSGACPVPVEAHAQSFHQERVWREVCGWSTSELTRLTSPHLTPFQTFKHGVELLEHLQPDPLPDPRPLPSLQLDHHDAGAARGRLVGLSTYFKLICLLQLPSVHVHISAVCHD